MTAATHIAATIEDEFNRRLTDALRRRGWRPRTIAHTGYGSPDFVRVLGRVVMSRNALPQADAEADSARPQRGWRPYATAPVGMIPVTVDVGGRSHRGRADRGGYIDLIVRDHGLGPGWHEVTVRARASAPVQARVLVVGADDRLAMVSDIDDTVMVTSVPRPLLALWNTFVRHSSARRQVPGMADLYRQVRQQCDGQVPVFYLSTGAWNAVPTITQFLNRHAYPAGPKLMTDWGPTNTGWFRSGREHKERSLRRLREEFPQLRWILVGDDGQRDPAIYRQFARDFPDAVAAIAIRQLSPAEQVLSHGTPTALPEGSDSPSAVPQVEGGDGEALAPQLLALLADGQA